MAVTFSCDSEGSTERIAPCWEMCVGSGHALLALRADWQAQLKRCHDELGFGHIRFHGILDDDMGTLTVQQDRTIYQFHNVDRIFDYLLSIGMRPIVELSFMPRALASGDQTVFHYGANVTPPRKMSDWGALVSRLLTHLKDRYGIEEVAQWPIEIWNEPNQGGFWSGDRDDYFALYRESWRAIKGVDEGLRIGGPVTAQCAWIEDFLAFCEEEEVPPDFISTHTYPTDAFGSPGDDTKAQLADSHLGVIAERAEDVRRQVRAEKPIYFTEWSTSSNPRDPLHDEPYAAAHMAYAMLTVRNAVDACSWWTFTDIFEENYFPLQPFHGGFGLLTIHDIAKPVYRAFQILHDLPEDRIEVGGGHETVKVFAARDADRLVLIIVNLALPRERIGTETATIEISGWEGPAEARLRRIDDDHANPKALWTIMGEPDYPTPDQVKKLEAASELIEEEIAASTTDGVLRLELTCAPQSVTEIELRRSARRERPEPAMTDIAGASEGESDVQPIGSTAPGAVYPPSKGTPIPRKDPTTLTANDIAARLEGFQHDAFTYFTEYSHDHTGLVPDQSANPDICSIASVGFFLTCLPIAVERGWLSRQEAAKRAARTVRFFRDAPHGSAADATGHHGFFYHFLDMESGKRAWNSELSTIDTALLLAGVETARTYFDGPDHDEAAIRTAGLDLVNAVDWRWMMDPKGFVNKAWKPKRGFFGGDWEHYSEAHIMYVLSVVGDGERIPAETYHRMTEHYDWRHMLGFDWIAASPLFIHLFSQIWLDFRGLDDGHCRQRGTDYFENSRRAIAVQRAYASLNPMKWRGYDADVWGLSACAGPQGKKKAFDGRVHRFRGYDARGAPNGPDDGTLVPWGPLACYAHDRKAALEGTAAILSRFPGVLDKGRFVGSFNPSLPNDGPAGWICDSVFGLDQGLLVTMIENGRSELIWNLGKRSDIFRKGLLRLGFSGGWLSG